MSIQTVGVIPTLTKGQRLTVAMEYASMKPEDMALELRCSATTIRNYISGRTRIDWAHTALWAQVTGVDATWLELGEAEPTDGPGLSKLPHPDSNREHFDYQSEDADDYPFRDGFELAA